MIYPLVTVNTNLQIILCNTLINVIQSHYDFDFTEPTGSLIYTEWLLCNTLIVNNIYITLLFCVYSPTVPTTFRQPLLLTKRLSRRHFTIMFKCVIYRRSRRTQIKETVYSNTAKNENTSRGATKLLCVWYSNVPWSLTDTCNFDRATYT